jgi:hypothetical protein
MTEFYDRCFVNKHVDQFIRDHNDPHGERFSLWIEQKWTGRPVWDEERATRSLTPVAVAGGGRRIITDRSSAHSAAWVSPKRRPTDVGRRFKLRDARHWMRLFFWAWRDLGLLANPHVEDFVVRFIGHFMRVYERQGTMFARESARWSLDSTRTTAYGAADNVFGDIVDDRSFHSALQDLPPSEQEDTSWPYEVMSS